MTNREGVLVYSLKAKKPAHLCFLFSSQSIIVFPCVHILKYKVAVSKRLDALNKNNKSVVIWFKHVSTIISL